MDETTSLLAKQVASYGERTQYDAECKKFLSNRELLSRILQETVSEFKHMPLEQIKKCIISLQPEMHIAGYEPRRNDYDLMSVVIVHLTAKYTEDAHKQNTLFNILNILLEKSLDNIKKNMENYQLSLEDACSQADIPEDEYEVYNTLIEQQKKKTKKSRKRVFEIVPQFLSARCIFPKKKSSSLSIYSMVKDCFSFLYYTLISAVKPRTSLFSSRIG